MKSITLNAYAKINLYLDVTGVRDDGYHNIESVMQSVSLADSVAVVLGDGDKNTITQHFENSLLPCDETNICYKAAAAYLAYYGIDGYDIDITVTKNIPEAAGLAGGSADGAAVIRALDLLYDKQSSLDTLCRIGLSVGSDIPFCIVGSTAAVTGRGENVCPLAPLADERFYLVIAKSQSESVSTREAYRRIDCGQYNGSAGTCFDTYVKAVDARDTYSVVKGVYNIFEQVMSDTLSDTYAIIAEMKKYGALCAMMSGSGPSVFGIFESEQATNDAVFALGQKHFSVTCKMV